MPTNCRAVLKAESGCTPDQNFKVMLSKFRKRVTDAGVITLWKKKQYFESKGEKRRRKRKEAQLQRRKESSKILF
jgi:ribosomal protein S21